MGYLITTNKPNRAMRLARKLVKENLDWADLESVITEGMQYPEQWNELLTAVSADYMKKEKHLDEIEEQVNELGEEAKKLFGEFSNLHIDQLCTRQIAWFQLGYATALRLVGRPPEVEIIGGGNKEPKLRGRSSL